MFHLAFIEYELNELDIKETKAAKDEVLYFAAGNAKLLREIHYRKADSRNNDIIVHNYVPPSFYNRYMAISKECTRRRSEEKDLKTQVRFGSRDVEVYFKQRGEQDGYRQIKLEELMSGTNLPSFDYSAVWRKTREQELQKMDRLHCKTYCVTF